MVAFGDSLFLGPDHKYELIYSASTDLRMVSSARWYSLSARSNSLLRKLTCSSVADIPVLSLPLLQHVSRSPGHNQLQYLVSTIIYLSTRYLYIQCVFVTFANIKYILCEEYREI